MTAGPSPQTLEELRRLLGRGDDRRTETGIPRLAMVRGRVPEHELAAVYKPMINLILQGSKTMSVGDRTLRYDPATYFVMSVDLPAIGTIHAAEDGAPYLAVALTLEPARIAALLADIPPMPTPPRQEGFSVAAVTPELLDAWARLLRLMQRPEDIPALAPAYEREILYRVLSGPMGAMMRDIATPDTMLHRIHQAIQWLRAHYAEPVSIEALAGRAAMSVSAFHRHFKSVTSLSPLQFQKQLRLLQARTLLLTGAGTATSVAFDVGYESATQFSREYARLFGLPPGRDAAQALARIRNAPHQS
ncbi:AraC family transcriptional regulator [Albimonas pacifica]|nr:AraC family transcriptional regulator [Albimonas pacifica]